MVFKVFLIDSNFMQMLSWKFAKNISFLFLEFIISSVYLVYYDPSFLL